MVSTTQHKALSVEDCWQVLSGVHDPEVPVLTVLDLGIVRDVRFTNDAIVVDLTPTYTGCPATQLIEENVRAALETRGADKVEINRVLSPAWTTDWLSQEGREKLKAYGIAPPQGSAQGRGAILGHGDNIACPRCGSKKTRVVSEFGSTACKALYQCEDCLEPFDYFKCI